MTSADLTRGGAEVATRVFAPPTRLGWEFVEPEPARPAPRPEPQWFEPAPPNLLGVAERERAARARLPRLVGGGVLAGLLGLLFSGGALGALLLVGAVAALAGAFLPLALLASEGRRLTADVAAERDRARVAFDEAHRDWVRFVRTHDAAESVRVDSAMHWYPLGLDGAFRVDVVGGRGAGRDALLTVLGASLVAGGEQITLLDLTAEGAGTPLGSLLRHCDVPVEVTDLPAALDRVDLFAGLSSDDVAELLADILHPHGKDEGRSGRTIVSDLVRTACEPLAEPLDTARLRAALRVLARTDEPGDRTLTVDEKDAIVRASHDVVVGEKVTDELHDLLRVLRRLDGGGSAALEPADAPLTVFTSATGKGRDRKMLVDRLLVGRIGLSSRLRGTLVVAGADDLGRATVEGLGRTCRIAGVRLVLVFDHLRDDVVQLLGADRAATVLMHLGNAAEAEAAATQIGREHQFLLAQLSKQHGRTETVGGGTTRTKGDSDSTTEGGNHGGSRQGLHGGSNWGSSWSRTVGTSSSFAENSTWSLADSVTDGETVSRVYEFIVDPLAVASLPSTGFVLVAHGAQGRRVSAGDCNPMILELGRVAGTPRVGS